MNSEIEVSAGVERLRPLAWSHSSAALAHVPPHTQVSLFRMFTDPHLLEKQERAELVRGLRNCVSAHPGNSDLRVLFGMALCVNFNVTDAIEEFSEGVRLAPDSFIAHLKMGELWMRLRVCDKAEEHTRQAGLLARNIAQAELARRQAATIRSLVHNGIQRGGSAYKGSGSVIAKLRSLWSRGRNTEALATQETQ